MLEIYSLTSLVCKLSSLVNTHFWPLIRKILYTKLDFRKYSVVNFCGITFTFHSQPKCENLSSLHVSLKWNFTFTFNKKVYTKTIQFNLCIFSEDVSHTQTPYVTLNFWNSVILLNHGEINNHSLSGKFYKNNHKISFLQLLTKLLMISCNKYFGSCKKLISFEICEILKIRWSIFAINSSENAPRVSHLMWQIDIVNFFSLSLWSVSHTVHGYIMTNRAKTTSWMSVNQN